MELSEETRARSHAAHPAGAGRAVAGPGLVARTRRAQRRHLMRHYLSDGAAAKTPMVEVTFTDDDAA